jgi:hypothetical protein
MANVKKKDDDDCRFWWSDCWKKIMMPEESLDKNVQESKKKYLWHFLIPISFKYTSTEMSLRAMSLNIVLIN